MCTAWFGLEQPSVVLAGMLKFDLVKQPVKSISNP
jgi:hypothetical protein